MYLCMQLSISKPKEETVASKKECREGSTALLDWIRFLSLRRGAMESRGAYLRGSACRIICTHTYVRNLTILPSERKRNVA